MTLAVLLIAPWAAVIGVLLANASPKPEISAPPTPEAIEVLRVESYEPRTVELSVAWTEGAQLLSPAWTGLVTSLAPGLVGSALGNGSRVVQVDGVWRIAVATAAPFHRALGPGASGDDVDMLNALLRDLGYARGAGRDWSVNTATGVGQLAESLGLADVESFDPAWTIWLPSGGFAVSSTELVVGAPVPAAGLPLAEGPAVPVSAGLTGEDAALDGTDDGSWVIEIADVVVAFTGDPVSAVRDPPSELATVPRSDAPLRATIRRAEEIVGVQVPPAAVSAASDGSHCVWVSPRAASAPSDWRIRPARIIGGELGVTLLADTDGLDGYVLANPGEMAGELAAC